MKIITESRVPEVGPFYVIDNTVFSDSEPYSDIIEFNNHKDSDNTHYDYWRTLRRVYKEFRNIDYDYYPRGRVVYNSIKDKFNLYIDKCLDSPDIINNIIEELNLPKSKVEVDFDEHYQCHNCNNNYINITENMII